MIGKEKKFYTRINLKPKKLISKGAREKSIYHKRSLKSLIHELQ